MAIVAQPDLVQLATWLADARMARHALLTGKAVVEVAIDGATYVTKFDRVNADKLDAYILRLEAQIRNNGAPQRQGAIGIIFT